MQVQPENVTIFCTNILDTGTAFGMRGDTGEQIFIPAMVAKRVGIKIGNKSQATIIPNHQHGERTPWYAIQVDPIQDPDAPETLEDKLGKAIENYRPVAMSLDDRIARAIAEHEGAYHTTAEVATMVSVDTIMVSSALNRLFVHGRVARAEVHARADQKLPSVCLWAENVNRFIEGE